ncbi:ABC transporter ATP-binding protein [Bifidobacterium canis]|uniref:Peptide ABC transporter ATPase n=1 Tax=Bifidobacterium canis TaxID=2610880 RepID=A0A7K1J723_9BIFI|nr:dipeptide/oligopeptide/nickel ABC transporter ATP-binding protein [Bifidobacterium canis]MUH60464.1 peptide ABC transporter ATPase [Bifidobacterium canis]
MSEHDNVILEGANISKSFGTKRTRQQVLFDVNVHVCAGECLAVIGESGSGKTTLTRILLGLETPSAGDVLFSGASIEGNAGRAQLKLLREQSGIVYQNPFESLDPRWTAGRSVAEPLRLLPKQDSARARDDEQIGARVADALELVGLPPAEFVDRYPMDMSGGQAQRVAIARAIVKNPRILLADEPMSAIDVAARVQILDALAASRERNPQMAIVIVSHDLGVVQNIADRIVVIHHGRIVEQGTTAQVLNTPQEHYTKELIAVASM